MKIMSIGGIRPDWINLCTLFEEIEKNGFEHIIVHSGQHYSYNLDKIFFEELGIRKPDYFLEVGSGTHSEQTAKLLEGVEKAIIKEKPDLVISFSDGNPALAAIAATKQLIRVAHIESGMRSYDWRMPEEKNRRIIDSISDYLFTPTQVSFGCLVKEGYDPNRIFLVSKLIVDVLEKYKDKIDESKIMESLSVEPKGYFLAEAHRPENVENSEYLGNILKAFEKLYDEHRIPILFFAHPRTQASINKFNFQIPDGVKLMDYIGFFDFSKLEKNALCIMTDSGTLEEDACWFRVPCVTYRLSTERPETAMIGANMVSGLETDKIIECTNAMLKKSTDWAIPYPLGATKRIVNILKFKEEEIKSPKVWW